MNICGSLERLIAFNQLLEAIIIKILFTILIIFTISSCVIVNDTIERAEFEFENGFNDSFSSASGLFERSMCAQQNFRANVILTESELNLIGQSALKSGFFEITERTELSKVYGFIDEDGTTIQITAPCAKYRLRIKYGDRENLVSWQCNDHVKPDKLKEVLETIDSVLYEHSKLEKLPQSSCRYR